ncbi:MAG: hypothetical protein DME04_09635 [Candidatus Rokuibacteriota bacterium]|nr:MAG: hypothetical protein DME04_09635 [Candidatus Rokubacteria bacterium]
MSSPTPNVISPVSPPDLTIFRRRSLAESSFTHPSFVHPLVATASVVSRTRLMARRSMSFAAASDADDVSSTTAMPPPSTCCIITRPG